MLFHPKDGFSHFDKTIEHPMIDPLHLLILEEKGADDANNCTQKSEPERQFKEKVHLILEAKDVAG